MEDDVRSALTAYFERDIGRPPHGARERVLAGLEASARRSRPPQLAWAAAVAAALIGALVVVTLLGVRGVHRTQPAAQNEVPGPRSGAAVAYDAARGVVVMFGGTPDGTTALGDTWTWDGARWTRLHPAVSPPLDAFAPVVTPGRPPKPQTFAGLLMAYDASSRSLVLYGIPGSTWTWDGRNWHRHSTAPPQQGPGGAAAMAYDPRSRAVLLYFAPVGGSSQTWRWDGATWTEVHPTTTPDVVSGSMAFDGSRLLLFGSPFGLVQGQALTETWAWDGAEWSQLSPGVRLPISYSWAAAYDQARGRVVALVEPEGQSSSETWVWDGTTWSREHPQHEPPARFRAMAWYDARAQRVVLYGGIGAGATTALGDMWAWDGTDWTMREETRR
jgi:hypothetical protein